MPRASASIALAVAAWLPAVAPLSGAGPADNPAPGAASNDGGASARSAADLRDAGSESARPEAKTAPAAGGKSAVEQLRERAQDKAKEKPKPDFNRLLLRLKLSDRRDALHMVKPGHWTALNCETCANHFDFLGSLRMTPCEQNDAPLALKALSYYLTVDRPAVLPKGQKKTFDTPLFVPPSPHHPWVASSLSNAESQVVKREKDELQPMPAYQFQLVILARTPERYGYLQSLPSMRLFDEYSGAPGTALYRLVAPVIGVRAPLPGNALQWTSVAAIIWDDLPPDVLDDPQRLAMLDWLHWGGQLILSGPRTLEAQRGGFLAPYLPATASADLPLEATRLAALDRVWSTAQEAVDRKALAAERNWPAARLSLQPGGRFLEGADELIAERRLGRGRIVVAAFSLSQPGMSKWRGFDGVLNACLLGRDPRKFTGQEPPVVWLDGDQNYADGNRLTAVRFFARDEPSTASGKQLDPPGELILGGRPQVYPLDEPDALGVAAWDDFSAIPKAARGSLRRGAGIAVPSPRFVVWMVALYLLAIAPLNWSVFRLLGRVEWAWAAAPVISLSCAALVIWLAQLDIGFTRSVTELSIVEAQGNYRRAHLTRFTALYASLSTSYSLAFEEPTALALPFATSADHAPLAGETSREVQFDTSPQPRLAGVEVASNSTGMVRSECFFDLGGSFDWSEAEDAAPSLTNATSLSLSGASLVRRGSESESRVVVAWIGALAPGAVARPEFKTIEREPDVSDPWNGRRPQASPRDEQALDLEELVCLAEETGSLAPGETRLVGWHLDEMPGERIEPAGARRRRATLVVARLAMADADARPDVWEPNAKDPFNSRRVLEFDLPAQLPEAEQPAAGP